jgi:PTS system galactitol-specific IIB component
MKKKILVICGTGIATSTVVVSKIKDYLSKFPEFAGVQITQGKVMDVLRGTDADVVVATTQVPDSVKVPVVNAVPLLTGVGAQQVLEQIKKALVGE